MRLAAMGLFGAAALLTLYYVHDMSRGMAMPGGWTMSMMWMRMPDQGVLEAALMFAAMWLAMMVAMMLPSALPMLLLYRRVMSFRGEMHLAWLTGLVGAGYFAVWALFGGVAYPLGLAIAGAAMASEAVSRLVPFACGAALVLAGVYQLTPWKAACLRHCRDPLRLLASHLPRGRRGALALGLWHGAFCAGCCWALMLTQIALGIMNLAAMIAIAAVIAAEKLLPSGERLARALGPLAIAAGVVLCLRALL